MSLPILQEPIRNNLLDNITGTQYKMTNNRIDYIKFKAKDLEQEVRFQKT